MLGAIGFDVDQVHVFVESLRINYTGDVLPLIRWPGLRVARYLKSRRIDVILKAVEARFAPILPSPAHAQG